MMIAVISVKMVQMAGNQIVDVVAVRNRLVAAASAMLVALLMALANMIGSTTVGIRSGHLNHMFIDMPFMWRVQMPIMEVVRMVIVLHRSMTAVFAMLMTVPLVDRMCLRGHENTSP
jgi:hypothetical protein